MGKTEAAGSARMYPGSKSDPCGEPYKYTLQCLSSNDWKVGNCRSLMDTLAKCRANNEKIYLLDDICPILHQRFNNRLFINSDNIAGQQFEMYELQSKCSSKIHSYYIPSKRDEKQMSFY
uniref:CHCH domain-containing protein n=1 Tax=Oryza nivara TaxID=4536 RepID=A0A0E0HXP6_ORYNI